MQPRKALHGSLQLLAQRFHHIGTVVPKCCILSFLLPHRFEKINRLFKNFGAGEAHANVAESLMSPSVVTTKMVATVAAIRP